MKYDVIVIGAGNGGLMAATILQKQGKKVLLLEKKNEVGGLATSIVRGRFEFDLLPYEMEGYGEEDYHGVVYDLFSDLGIQEKVSFLQAPICYHIVTLDSKEEYVMPSNISDFITQMEVYAKGSTESVTAFFDLAEETVKALEYLRKGSVDDVFMERFPNFIVVSTYSLDDVLQFLKMPKKAQQILSAYWIPLGSPSSMISFVYYASFLLTLIKYGPWKPKNGSLSISMALEDTFTSLGGTVKLNACVTEFLMEQDTIKGVLLQDGTKYYADYIISNISPNLVYGKFLPSVAQKKNMKKLVNSRTLGGRGFCVCLGLNQSPKDLGLNYYNYFVYHQLDSTKEFKHMGYLYHDTCVGTVLNILDPKCSDEGTTILTLTSFYSNDVFSKSITEQNYHDVKEKVAERFIDSFERATGVKIKHAIEEIEIVTPVTYARYTGQPDGTIYGYMAKGYDNMLPRIFGEENEKYLSNVRFCGSFSSYLSTYGAGYFSGYDAAMKTLKDMRNVEERKNEN